jgi:hypothetical protein
VYKKSIQPTKGEEMGEGMKKGNRVKEMLEEKDIL